MEIKIILKVVIKIERRNIAIIAHVDHGKTTLVDALLKQSAVFRANEQVEDRVLDRNDLERERGITILSKNTAINYKGVKINIVDTPGHADFGGEVERVLNMVDGVLLVVDAFEGAMPQTKYVLRKAMEHGLKAVVVINKIDRAEARISEVEDEIMELFMELDATDEQLEYKTVYTAAKAGIAKLAIGEVDEPLQMMVTTLEADEYVGKVIIGRINRGVAHPGEQVLLITSTGQVKCKIGKVYVYEGLKRVEVDNAEAGEIVALTGLTEASIGDTICDVEHPDALEAIRVDEPTLSVTFGVNTSPLAGQEGEYVTSRHIRDRLFKEAETNVALRVEETDSADVFKVSGRGELHLSILIETMRREGFELSIGKPEVVYKIKNGQKLEPMELLTVEVPAEYMGTVMESMGRRKGELKTVEDRSGYQRLEFEVPARGLIGFRSELLTATRGNGIMNHVFSGYAPYKGDIPRRTRGSLVAFEAGETTGYGIFNLQERGVMFVEPGMKVYEGMIVGENSREMDIDINPCKAKHATNMRASGSDEAIRLVPARIMSLEQAMEYINEDEAVEVTPKSIRLRKLELDRVTRGRAAKNARK